MAMSATITLVNSTGSMLLITGVNPVNDDATLVGIKAGDRIPNGASETLVMANSSVFIAPKGVGADITFVCQSNFQPGEIYLDDPAVGQHTFTFGNLPVFSYNVTNPAGNNYFVTVALVS